MSLKNGPIAKNYKLASVRPLTRDDLATLRAPRFKINTPVKLRDSHHRIARLVAIGLRTQDIQAKTGYSHGRLSHLINSPAFEELVAKYRGQVDAAFVQGVDDYYDMATQNMLKAERQIADRLDEADELGETLPVRELVAISRDAADRFGYGKKQTNTNINVDFAAAMEKAIARSGKTIEATPQSASISGPRSAPPAVASPTGPESIRRRA